MEIDNTFYGVKNSDKEERGDKQHIIIEPKVKNSSLFNDSNVFYVTVNCGIMLDAGINKGDTVLVNKSVKPLNGNVVVASISGDVVIRFYQKVQSKIFLSGDAGKVCPIQIEPGFEDFEILGVVTYVVKRLV